MKVTNWLAQFARLADRRTLGHEYPRVRLNRRELAPNGRHVIIVGAGLTGLAAALELLDRGFAVTVLERSTAAGGRLLSWRDTDFGHGFPVPLERATHGVWWTYKNLREMLGRQGIRLRRRWVNGHHMSLPIIGADGRTRRLPVGRHLPSILHGAPFFWRARQAWGESRSGIWQNAALGPRHLWPLMAFDAGRASDVAYLDGLSAADWARAVGLPPAFITDFADPLLDMCNFQSSQTSSALAWHRFSSTHFGGWRDLRATQFFDGPASESLIEPLVVRVRARGGRVVFGAEVVAIHAASGRFESVDVRPTAVGETRCPACHAPGSSPCQACGYRGPGFVQPGSDALRLAADAALVAVALPAARRLFGSPPWCDLPFFGNIRALPTARPTIVYLRYPTAGGESAWRKNHGAQEVLFTSRFATIGTIINTTMVHRQTSQADPADVVEVDLARGERFAGLSDDDLARRVHAELTHVVPGLGAPTDHRILRWDDFTTCEVGSERLRPGVVTPIDNLYLAGDWVRLEHNCYYMEKCIVSGRIAVSTIARKAGIDAPVTILPSESPSLPLSLIRKFGSVVPRGAR